MTGTKEDRETHQFITDLKHQVQDLSKNNVWLRNRLNYYRKQNDSLANKSYNHIQPKVDTGLKRKPQYVSLIQSMNPNADHNSVIDPPQLNEISQTNLSPQAHPVDFSSIQTLLHQAIEPHLHSIEDLNHQLVILQSENAVLRDQHSTMEDTISKLNSKLKDKKNSRKNLKSFEKSEKENSDIISDLQDQIAQLENKLKLRESTSMEHLSSLKVEKSHDLAQKEAEIKKLKNKVEQYKPVVELLKKQNIETADLESYLQLINKLNDLDILTAILKDPSKISKFDASSKDDEIKGLQAALEEEQMQSEKWMLERETMNKRLAKLDKQVINEKSPAKEQNKDNTFTINIYDVKNVDFDAMVISLCIPNMDPIIINKLGPIDVLLPIQLAIHLVQHNKLHLVQSENILLEEWLTECMSTSTWYEYNLMFEDVEINLQVKLSRECDYMIRTLLADLTCLKLHQQRSYIVSVAVNPHTDAQNIKIVFGNQFCLSLDNINGSFNKIIPGGVFALVSREQFKIEFDEINFKIKKTLADVLQEKFSVKDQGYNLHINCTIQNTVDSINNIGKSIDVISYTEKEENEEEMDDSASE